MKKHIIIYMRYIIIFLYFFLLKLHGHQYEKDNIIIDHPILKMDSNNSKVGAGYFKIINNTANKIVLDSIHSNISEKQEIHEVILKDEVYKMRPLKKPLSILPGKEFILKSKSFHIMFYNIKQPHVADEFLKAKVLFNRNIDVEVKFKVLIGNDTHEHH